MPLSNQRIADLISLMQKTYPGWTNFSDSSYIKDEVGYKRDAIAKTHKLLRETELSLLLDEGKFDEIISRLKSIGHATNLLYTAVPSSGDLAILEDDKLDKPAFSRQIFQLLYGLSASQDRLDDFLNYVRDNGLPNRWTFPTYFLFMCHPDTEMFIKPTATKAFFEYLGIDDLGFSSTPSGETYAKIKQLSHQLKDELEEYEPHDMVDIQSLIFVFYDKVKKDVIKPEKRSEFLNLFREFVSTYLLLPEGEKHSAYYEKGREQARKNLEDIKGALGRGEAAELTDQILSKLLPYSDTASNRDKGYWISIAPAFSADLRIKFEAAGWRKDGWTEVANMILNFVRRCDEHPDQLSEACTEFSESPYSRGLQTGTLTPILNALRPDKFVLINNKSRRVLNYFADKSYTQSLIDYPKANSTAHSLIENVKEDLQILSKKNLLAVDLFDEFSHWLIAIKHHPLGSTGYWKIAPGENAWNWDASREGGFITIGWEELGDISKLSRSQFNARRDELLKKYPDWKKIGIDQVWKFAHIKEGDRIIANRGTAEVLGIGSVTGPYYFVEGVRHGHRIPVEWEDITPRRINKPGWKRTLIELTQEEFDEISPGFAIPSGKSSWIFQANPKIFDIEGAIAELTEMNWKVNRYRDRIHAGDTVYIWEAGEDAGIVAVGKILSNPALIKDSESEKKFSRPDAAKEKQEEQYIGVHISIEELETRIERRNLLNHPAVSSMQILMHPQGTNFILTDKEAKVLEDLIHPSKPKNPEYPLELCSAETGFDESTLARWIQAVERKGQAIVYGPPGTGKTFVAGHIAKHLIGGGDGFKEIVQFHPAYSYEDFVQGIRPKSRDDGNLEFSLVPGRFLDFCRKARGCNDTCVLIIDEINRANLAGVFGELMYLLEYRGKEIPLAAGENHFSIPENVRIIGTMNTADRSIALVDHALRRRFAFLQLQPEYNALRLYHEREGTGFPIDKLIQVLMSLNEEIKDPHFEIGISYFMNIDLKTQIEDIWKMEIEPYLEEYFFQDKDKMKNYRWDSVKSRLSP